LNIFEYNRIIIVGNNGSGKSFLAKELSIITGLPLIHLDLEFWRPNWEETPEQEWMKKQLEFIAKEKWIIDGNHSGATMELRFQATDLVIFIDINRFVCLLSAFTRQFKKRPDIPQYLDNKLDLKFLRFCKGLWKFPENRRRTIMDLHKKYPDKPFFVIESRRKMKKLLNQWRL